MFRHYLIGILALLNFGVVAPAKTAPALPPDITVAADGSGDFKTVQDALNSIPRDNKQRMIVLIKDGVYPGQLRVASRFVTLRGQSRKGTRLEFGNGAAAVLNVNANDLVLENLSVINTVGVVGPHEVAIAGRQCDHRHPCIGHRSPDGPEAPTNRCRRAMKVRGSRHGAGRVARGLVLA
jgi:pectinesterase